MTAEGWIKKIVKEMLDLHPRAYYHMPVQNGMGSPTLDFICCVNGRYVAIETKAPGKRMTDRQELTAKEIEAGGGVVYRDVGTYWSSLTSFHRHLFSAGRWEIASDEQSERWTRWRRWYDNAEGKDARKPEA